MKNKLFAFLKGIYKKLPFSYKLKNRLKSLFYKCFGFLFKNTTSYRAWSSINRKEIRKSSIIIDVKKIKNYVCTKKIAIQLHLYYVDLSDEFVKYLSNIPYKFDLFISVVDKNECEYVRSKFLKIKNIDKIFIEVVKNRGRDVAPLIAIFGKEISKYDYVCHIHSKKSLFTGTEQTEWRVHLLEGLMGNEDIVRSHLFQLDKGENIGLLYPETFGIMPYQGHTWLQNQNSRDELLDKINVHIKSDEIYFDYPMGTMFWASVNSIKQFFTSGIKVEDFPKEAKQVDGTIAHAFERCLGLVCKYNGYNLLVFDKDTMSYSYTGKKNLKQYTIKSYEWMKDELEGYDRISFDIFDTLLSRKISNPRAILDLVEMKIDKKYKINSKFCRIRLEAETIFRMKNPEVDCDLQQIYNEIKKISNLKDDVIDSAFNIEIEIEKKLLAPKKNILDVYNHIKNCPNKEVNIVSDMQLSIEDIETILRDNGVNNPDKIYLSSNMNIRKDRGDMWEKYVSDAKGKTCIHIGDDEVSDVQKPGDYNVKNYHVMGNKALFQLTNMGKVIGSVDDTRVSDSVQLGLIYDKMFSDPFAYNETEFNVYIQDANTFGYVIFGPIVLNYILWLMIETKKIESRQVLFFAREGYLLKKVYDTVSEIYNGKIAESEYLYVSRRALTCAAMENEYDIEMSLEKFYEGNLKNLLAERFGIIDNEIKDEDIKLPDNKNKVLKVLEEKKDAILSQAYKERKAYLEYYKSNVSEKDNIIVSDIGYSGTIQYYLSKLTGKIYHGRYFATDEKKLAEKIVGNTMYGYYIDNDAEQEISSSNIHKYHLILEGILIGKDAQLVRIEDGGPVFAEKTNNLYNSTIEEIHNGILLFANDYAQIMGEVLLDEIPQKNLAERLMELVVRENVVDKKIINDIIMDDKYCGGGLRNPIDYYKR